MDEIFEPRPWDIAGFELAGRREADGTITIGVAGDNPINLPAFPAKVRVAGTVFNLEDVKENTWRGRKMIELTAPDDERLKLCWGVYV